jgi:hypothetical protein
MGRRGNQTFLKNQKAQKRVARANAKRAEKQARRDEKVARAATGDGTTGPPIEWNEGENPELGASQNGEGGAEADAGDDADADDPAGAAGKTALSSER